MIKILKYFSKVEWLISFVVIILVIMQVYLDLTLPDYMSEITLLISSEGSLLSDVLIAGAKMLGCAIGSLFLSAIVAVFAAKIAANFSARLRKSVFSKVKDFSNVEINKFSTSSLITRTTNDVTQVQILIVMGLQAMIKAPITAIWAITKIVNKNITWSVAVAVAVVVLISIVTICLIRAIPKFKILQKLTDDLNKVTRESLSGVSVVRAYNAEEYQEGKFEEANEALTSVNLFANKTMSFIMPSIQSINSFLLLSIYFIGAYLISEAQFENVGILFSDMIVFTAYAMQIIMSFMILIMVFILLPRSAVSAKRINEVLDEEISILSGEKKNGQKDKIGEVEFKDVTFTYPDGSAPVLEKITFSAKKGEFVAIIGATGSGKSSIINLIPRFYDVTNGSVYVEGIDVREYDLKSLRDKIGYVSQKAILLNKSVEENVSYGSGNEIKNVKQSIKIAQGEPFVQTLDKKYKTIIAEGGKNLSGGQKQRLSIARAICKNPDILIFDDSFSALDYKTDKLLREELSKKYSDKTRIVIAQRIGTIRNADKIIVVENGEIDAIGTHSELIKKSKVYKEIALSQLSKEEL